MQRVDVVKKPEYAVESVDKALQLLVLLQEREWVRLSDVANELSVASSTAHRLLATMIYRGFALQDEQRRYCAGPQLRLGSLHDPYRRVVAVARPHLEALAGTVRETVNLVERIGVSARFLFSAEGTQLLRVGNRAGSILPAHTSSAGKAALSTLPVSALERLYSGHRASVRLTTADLQELHRELVEVRTDGYAVNLGRTEPEIAAVGAPIGSLGRPGAYAVSISCPTSRADEIQQPRVVAALLATCAAIKRDFEAED